MNDPGELTYLNTSVSPDGGSLGLALTKSDGEIVHFTLDRGMGSATLNRIIFMDRTVLSVGQEKEWLPVFQKVLEETDFRSDPEKDIVEKFVKLMESRAKVKVL